VKRVLRALGQHRRFEELASELRWQPTRDELVTLFGKLEREWARHLPQRWR
jgi:hypothetical protein